MKDDLPATRDWGAPEGVHTVAAEEHRKTEEWGIAAGEHRIAVVDHTAAEELAGRGTPGAAPAPMPAWF